MQEARKFIFTVLLWATLAANPVLANKIASYKISDSGRIVATVGHILKLDGTGDAYWEHVGILGIADAAVTPEKTAGVVGAIPVGAADSTTYGSFWVAPPLNHTFRQTKKTPLGVFLL
jgi:hypothetical protein